jgi:hypothetical protein
MRKDDARDSNLSLRIDRLEKRHRLLKSKVDEFDHRVYLTSAERMHLAELKKKKLAAKDALAGLLRDSSAHPRMVCPPETQNPHGIEPSGSCLFEGRR